ncbi:hypothetical protein [Sphaerospermopsis sp. FACHB-1194]|nr:hypothetical protein [Sphaerospermopsis sp. FACHB-1194]
MSKPIFRVLRPYRSQESGEILPITHYPLPITHYPLPVTFYNSYF